MKDVLLSVDPVLISFVESLLQGAGIAVFVADRHISGIEGGINAFPRRVQVGDDDLNRARQVLADAGLASHLVDRGGS